MKSGLEGRNKMIYTSAALAYLHVSMKSGLEGRNKLPSCGGVLTATYVSMKSGLEGRNKGFICTIFTTATSSLNEVRPRRPEQTASAPTKPSSASGLNEVRPRRPEQRWPVFDPDAHGPQVSMKSGLEGRNKTLSQQYTNIAVMSQ